MRDFGESRGDLARGDARLGRGRGSRVNPRLRGYDSEYDRLGGDYENVPRHAGSGASIKRGFGWPRRETVVRRDWREWGDYRGAEPSRDARGPRGRRRLPPDYRRYLSREEYGLPPELESGIGGYGREFLERGGGSRSPGGRRDALFGGRGFRRYDRDYDDYAW